MFTLLSEKDKRKFQIISHLFQAGHPLTIAFLAKEMGCSIRTVQYDLEELKTSLTELNGAILSSPDGILLDLPYHVGIDYFQRQLYKNSPGFNLLELIFFDETYTSDELAELLFLSPASLNRLVIKVRQALNRYGLELSTLPFKIVGNEILIRNFYTTYFSEAYSINEWPFPNVSREFLVNCIDYVIDYYNLCSDLYEFHKFLVRHAVEISRAKKGYFIEEFFIESIETRQRQYQAFMLVSQEISQHLNLSREELTIYFTQIINWKFYFSLPFLKERIQANAVTAQQYEDFLEAIMLLSDLFHIPKSDHTYLIFELNSILELYALFPAPDNYQNIFLFHSQTVYLLSTFEKEFSLFYLITKKEVIRILNKQNLYLNDAIVEKLMFTLLSKWRNLYYYLNKTSQSLNILVYNHQHIGYTKFMIDILESKFNKFISFSILEELDIYKSNLFSLEFDILISSVSLNLVIPQPIFFLYPHNIKGSFHSLETLINEVGKNKKEKQKQEILAQLSKRREYTVE